ncbi:hypothetical protein KSP40_PGU015831 [Platanthera guangdongensis]|uniref:Uncharacterized protein n=1 Tax=Platanthera guangdongensis TaxID=2320717 RepID=A0ABR2M3N0_9ASPA
MLQNDFVWWIFCRTRFRVLCLWGSILATLSLQCSVCGFEHLSFGVWKRVSWDLEMDAS